MSQEILKEQRKDLLMVDVNAISVVEGFNVRTDYGNIDELAQSILENGMRVPMRGYKKDSVYYLTDGHRRFAACQKLIADGHSIRVPFISEKNPSQEKMLLDMFICNDGKRLNPVEEAELVTRLLNLGLKGKEIAKKIGRTEASVSNLKKLGEIPTPLKRKIEKNEVSATLVLKMLKGSSMTAEDILAQVEAIANENVGGGSANKSKVTESKVNTANGEHKSALWLKQIVTDVKPSDVGNKELYNFLKKVYAGKLTKDHIYDALQIDMP